MPPPEQPLDPGVTPRFADAGLPAGEAAHAIIGRYHLLEKIGEGGMGEVWLAEQKEPVRRRVALKLVKGGLASRQVITRFESERQALALMDHPAIAKVLDAGSTPQGVPYFVMEYVAGVPITAYCDDHRLSTRDRLELFVRVCEGVQHAHQKAIIHRDLKPSNILVTEVDGKPVPKIIDFGVAKAVGQKLTADTLHTHVGALVGTPEYMSPEQALSVGEDIDTRTDVYSLGVIFYELLAGTLPLEMRKVALDEFLRRLRDDDAPKPSTQVRTRALDRSTELARKRQTEPLTLVRQMRGDLDAIALKALEKDRERRYGSAAEFAADVERYLRNEAVLAVAPSAAYRARKFARRHRAALVTACAFTLVIMVAVVVSVAQSIRANREAAVAEAVNNFLQNDLLAQASVAKQLGHKSKPDPHLEVRAALDRAAARITDRFASQPEVEAAIRDTIGQTYLDLGLCPEAHRQLERARDLYRQVLGAGNQKTLKAASRDGVALYRQGKYAEGQVVLEQTLADQRRFLGPENPDTLVTMTSLANAYDEQGKYKQAETLFQQVLAIDRRAKRPDRPHMLATMNNLSLCYENQGRFREAQDLLQQVLPMRQRLLGSEHPDTVASMNNLANIYADQGEYARAEALDSQTLEIFRRVLGPEHPDTLASSNNLAADLLSEGKFPQAEQLRNETFEATRRVLGPENPGTLRSMNNLGTVYYAEGKYAQAEAIYNQALAIRRRLLGPEHADTLLVMNNLATTYACLHRYAESEELMKLTIAAKRRTLGPQHASTLESIADFAFIYQQQGKYSSAETEAADALAGRRKALGAEHPETMASAADLALAYVSQHKFAEAEPLAREAVEFGQKKQPDDWQRFRAESLLGASLAGQGNYTDAEPLLLKGYQGMQARKDRIAAPDRYHLDRAHEWLVELYQDWGKPAKAAEWRTK